MSITRQLVVLIAGLLLLVLAGTFAISVSNTKNYVQSQLSSHAQDAATSLGLSLSLPMGDGDEALAESIITAVFDRGDYQNVKLSATDGNLIIERTQNLNVNDVPMWFVDVLDLDVPIGEALVMTGWSQTGKVVVQSHPGYAYQKLWHSAIDTLRWFFVCTVIACLVGIVVLKILLRPLKLVQAQAESICAREFTVVEQRPATLELRQIVDAMNRLSNKVRSILGEQERLADRLRSEINQDHVTRLGNKRYFEAHLADRLSGEAIASGAVFLVELSNLTAINDEHGYAVGDELLRTCAVTVSETMESYPRCLLARLSGAFFAIFLEDVESSEAAHLAAALRDALMTLHNDAVHADDAVACVGVVHFSKEQVNAVGLMEQVDDALRHAKSEGPNSWHLLAEQAEPMAKKTAQAWREQLTEALLANDIMLHFQPVFTCPHGAPMHHEVLVRMRDNGSGELLVAGAFMPAADRFGLAVDIDRRVVDLTLQRISQDGSVARIYAVNLSPHSLDNEEFLRWLEKSITAHPLAAQRLIFEFAEYAAVTRLDAVRALIDRLWHLGVRFSLDHFGRDFGSFAYLQSLRLAYLKISGGHQQQLSSSAENQFFVQSLADIAHGLDMQVIAEGVESEEVWLLLPDLHVDGGQGYFLGMPGPIEEGALSEAHRLIATD